jgi:hypothetical protein
MTDVLHVVPVGDLIEHDTSTRDAACVCGPTTTPVKNDDGSVGWLLIHHSFDGRELHEGDRS